jgi:DNA-directed RNA polymerase specialized sigma24 family protein
MHTQCVTHTNIDGYELFRRAIVERDDQAWAEGTARYRAMLIAWVGRCSASAIIPDRRDDIADLAFARAWSALTPDRFAKIPTLGALLAYLRMCVTTAVIDCARSEKLHEQLSQAIEAGEDSTPEQVVIEQLSCHELWRMVGSQTHNQQERVILVEGCMYGLRPSAILARHPQLFANVGQIYTAKRNFFERLKRNPEIQRLHRDW